MVEEECETRECKLEKEREEYLNSDTYKRMCEMMPESCEQTLMQIGSD